MSSTGPWDVYNPHPGVFEVRHRVCGRVHTFPEFGMAAEKARELNAESPPPLKRVSQ